MQLSQITYGHQVLLNEANLINVKDLYNDVSVTAYAKQFAKGVGDKALAAQFVSKFSKFMLNDERWHDAVRQLPADAPQWAVDAFNKRDLMAFKPDDNLNDQMSHIMHYLEAISTGQKKTNPNKDDRAFAQREYQGITKLPDFNTLVKKSNDFFKRGSKKAANAKVEGMKEIYDTGTFVWYMMTEAGAFQKEGKVMQNCLGSYWTLSKAKKEGQSVVIMKKKNGESVVAARIENGSNEIMEMKGKNNKPPVDEYMGGVLDFIRARKLKIGLHAVNDFKKAGYFYIDDKLYTRLEAIEKFVTHTDVGNVGSKKLVRINIHKDVLDLIDKAYSDFGNKFGRHRAEDREIYELRDGSGFAVISALVKDKKLIGLHRAKRQAETNVVLENVDSTSSIGRELIKQLYDLDIIDSIHSEMHDDLFWNDRLEVNDEGEIKPVSHEKVKSKEGGYHWEKHDDPERKKYIHSKMENGHVAGMLDDRNLKSTYLFKPSKAEQAEEDVHHFGAFSTHHKPAQGRYNWSEDHAEDTEKPGMLIPTKITHTNYSGHHGRENVSHQTIPNPEKQGATGKKHVRNAKSIIELANTEGLELAKNFKYNHGVITDADGKHKVFDDAPKKITDNPPSIKFDLKKYNDTDRLTIINHLATSTKLSPIVREEGNAGHNTRLNGLLHQPGLGMNSRRSRNAQTAIQDDTNEDSKETSNQKIQTRYRGNVIPDAIYVAQVGYGNEKKHSVILSATGKEITQVDGLTRDHDFQHWGDVDKVAEQLNTMMDAAGLTIKKGILNKKDAKELRIKHGNPRRFTSAAGVAEGRIEKLHDSGAAGLEGTDTLPFKDGGKLEKMDPSDQALWLRQSLKSYKVPGVGWQVKDKNGEVVGTIFVKNGKIMSGFHSNPSKEGANDTDRGRGYQEREAREPGTVPGIIPDMIPELQTAMNEFGWTVSDKAMAHVRDHDTDSRINFKRFGNKGEAEYTRHSVNGKIARSWVKRGWAKKIKTEKKPAQYPSSADPDLKHTYDTYKISRKGQKYLEDISGTNWVSHDPMMTGDAAKLEDDFIVPPTKVKERKQRAPRTPGTPGATSSVSSSTPRAGSKADQALSLFRQHVTDNDEIPSRRDFMSLLQAEPFNMSPAGSSTYYANTKKKYSALNEKYSVLAALELMVEQHLFLGDFV